MDTYQLGLRNEMALGIFEHFGQRSPSEEELRSLEGFLCKFIILPNPVYRKNELSSSNQQSSLVRECEIKTKF